METLNALRPSLSSAVSQVLRPLVRLLLRHGMSFSEFSAIAKGVFVQVAARDFPIPGKKQTISRISVLSGLTRKEVQRLATTIREPGEGVVAERYNRAARVVAGWVRDPAFTDESGDPRPLALDDGPSSFAELVRLHSGDVPARAVLDELVRVEAVEHTDDGRLRLRSRAYIPQASGADKLGILGADVADLITTIDHNLQSRDGAARFQRKVMYDNLPREAVAEFRTRSAAQAQLLLEILDRWLSTHDRDENPAAAGTGRMRAGLGIFYFEENIEETDGGRDDDYINGT
ncbi:MAG: hypothetical protein KJ634_11085 [Gammaproteobacteria bacterium]|nr:hypothetical protein [Gammaproteobacteria bacterium]MBU1416157.1 hypothetical protein [Gammaproteobacteria bacterium]